MHYPLIHRLFTGFQYNGYSPGGLEPGSSDYGFQADSTMFVLSGLQQIVSEAGYLMAGITQYPYGCCPGAEIVGLK